MSVQYIDGEFCPKCDELTNKFVGECEHCGWNRWTGGYVDTKIDGGGIDE